MVALDTPTLAAVRVPLRLYVIAHQWCDVLDRIRLQAPHILPLNKAEDAGTVRAVFAVLDWEAGPPDKDGTPTQVRVQHPPLVGVPADVWALVAGWLPIVRTARFNRVPLTFDELMALQEAERLFAELDALREPDDGA